MRKKVFGSLAVILTLVMLMAACNRGTENSGSENTATTENETGTGEQADTPATTETIKIGWISASWSDDYCKRMSDALEEIGPKYGFEVMALNGNADVTTYIECIDTILQSDVKGVIIQPLFSVPDYCKQFNEQGIPLTFLNIVPQISEECADLEYYYAGSSEEKIGAQLAEAMADGLKENAKICWLCLPYGQDNTTGRLKGFNDWMAENRPDVTVLETNYITAQGDAATQAISIFEDWIQKYGVGGFDGVATMSSSSTQGVVEAMKSNNLDVSNFTLAGISASSSDWILEGIEFSDLYQDPWVEAEAGLKTLRAQIDGTTDQLELLEGSDNFVPVYMTTMTKDNADEYSSEAIAAKNGN
jgi:ABC-type sugar transport system substrate-binding protein